jgi:hypothetical protein
MLNEVKHPYNHKPMKPLTNEQGSCLAALRGILRFTQACTELAEVMTGKGFM